MDKRLDRPFTAGVRQSGLRDHNERLLLSIIQQNGPIAGSDLARQSGLSAQTVSVILRELESERLIHRGDPMRGKVGKPSIPMALNPDGAFSFGLKIGRLSADLALMDLHGTIREQSQIGFDYPVPQVIFDYLQDEMSRMTRTLEPEARTRVSGIGLAMPFEIWNWHELVKAPAEDFRQWRDFDFAGRIATFTDLPVFQVNDVTAACHAENALGRGREVHNYAYIFVGAFIGGGVVLNGSVLDGQYGNAGAFGSLPSVTPDGKVTQLLDRASINGLALDMIAEGADPRRLLDDSDWSELSEFVTPWTAQCAREIARAALSICSVIDFGAIVLDGAIPRHVQTDLVRQTSQELERLDTRGIVPPRIVAGRVGSNARVVGAAFSPLQAQHFLQAGALAAHLVAS